MANDSRSLSLTALAFRKLRKHHLAMGSLYVLIFLYVTCFIFSDFFSPYHFDDERRDLSYQPPSTIRLRDCNGAWHWPFVYRTSYTFDEYHRRVFTEDSSMRYPVSLFVTGDEHRLLGLIPMKLRFIGVKPVFAKYLKGINYPVRREQIVEQARASGAPDDVIELFQKLSDREFSSAIDVGRTIAPDPARLYLFGADSRGRDLLSRIIYAGRISLSIGLAGVAVSFTIGMLVGGLSGYYGGAFDNVTQRICEMIMMVPGFYLMLALRAALPVDISSVKVYFIIVFIMSFIGWAGMARVVRGMVLSIRSNEYTEAARAIGQTDLNIITRHILPQTLSYAIVSITLSIPGYILGESALSLLGLGIQDPYASWGNLLRDAMAISEIKFHPWILIPGVFIFLTVMSFNFLGDGLRDAFDPKSQLVGKEYEQG